MDVSLDDIIKQKKLSMPKRSKPAVQKQQQRRPQQQKQQQQQQSQKVAPKRLQQVGDARDRISKLRKQNLFGQDARGRIQQRKRLNIKDARQLLSSGKKQLVQQQQQQLTVRRQAPVAAAPLVVPKKVVANNLYRQRPAPPPQLEYEDDHYPPARPVSRPAREIPVQVTRQRRERSRSPVRRYAPPPPPPPPPPPQPAALPASSATIVQAYKVSIQNLHHGVTREDIYELFSSVGQVKKCVLLQPGSAEVVYPSKEHAISAIRRYDRRELDGMPMELRLSVVGIKVHSASGGGSGGGVGAGTSRSAGPIDERAVRAALFRGSGDHHHGGGGRPVNFKVSV